MRAHPFIRFAQFTTSISRTLAIMCSLPLVTLVRCQFLMLIKHRHLLCVGNIRYHVGVKSRFKLLQRVTQIAMALLRVSSRQINPQNELQYQIFQIMNCLSLLES